VKYNINRKINNEVWYYFCFDDGRWSFSPPTTQEDIDRIAYGTRLERVAEVVVALDAEVARLERIPRGHKYLYRIFCHYSPVAF